jgi:hypothetical protein
MYELARSYFPQDYLKRLRLRMPWFVRVAVRDPFPRLTLVNRLSRTGGPFFGPFLNRDVAQLFEQEVLSLFQLRRCSERLAPHPEHPGCIYGEMNQCLRPCQCAVSGEQYGSEVQRVTEFLSNNGRTIISTLSAARERACEQMNFEEAALLHRRIERVKAAARARDDVVTDVDHFNGVALTRSVQADHYQLWPMLQGLWLEPILLPFGAGEGRATSLDQELRQRLSASISPAARERKRVEDMAIFVRWYFSCSRDGQWFPFASLPDLNYRRLVHEISNLAKSQNQNQS